MAGTSPIHPTPGQLVQNAQHVGAGRQTGRADLADEAAGASGEKTRDARTADNAALEDRVLLQLQDPSHQAARGADNAAQTGQLQEEGRKVGGRRADAERTGRPASNREDLQEHLEDPSRGLIPAASVPAGGGSPPPPGGGAPPGQTAPPGGPGAPAGPGRLEQANAYKQWLEEQQQIQQIYAQIAADRQKWMMQMWKILQDTQTKIYEIIESVILNRAAVYDKINNAWSEVIRGAS